MSEIIFFDIEADKTPSDIGAVSSNNKELHDSSKSAFSAFIQGAEYLCGHNIFEHDLKYVTDAIAHSQIQRFIDTLYWSPLLFPSKPYHKIGKQYKIVSEDDPNNPVLDAKLTRDLFFDEISTFNKLDKLLKSIYYCLLYDKKEFKDFFEYIGFAIKKPTLLGRIFNQSNPKTDCVEYIKEYFDGKICENANLAKFIEETIVNNAVAFAGKEGTQHIIPFTV